MTIQAEGAMWIFGLQERFRPGDIGWQLAGKMGLSLFKKLVVKSQIIFCQCGTARMHSMAQEQLIQYE